MLQATSSVFRLKIKDNCVKRWRKMICKTVKKLYFELLSITYFSKNHLKQQRHLNQFEGYLHGER